MEDRLDVGGDELTFRVNSAESGGALIAYEVAFPAGGGPPALHRHDAFELIRVEQGELTFFVEDERGALRRTEARAGTTVAIPAGREHTVRNLSRAEARSFTVLAPGAAMEGFIRAAAALGGGESKPSPAELLALAAEHGVETTRPLEGVA